MRNLKIFLTSFILAFLYFGTMNIVTEKMKNIVYFDFNPTVFSAEIYQKTEPKNIEIDARAAISLRIDKEGKETVLYAKNENQALPIASLTKLMTALVVFDMKETYNPFQVLSVSKDAALQRGISILNEGESLTTKNLLYISLLDSSNDAAFSLAEAVGEENFVKLMNIYAEKMGLSKTKFVNSTGLNGEEENISTAREMAEILKNVKENYSEILEITKNQNYDILRPNGSLRHISTNTNILLDEFPEIIGGKTGWTPEAKGCLALIVKDKNGYIINVILGADDRFEEMRKLIAP